MTREDSTAAPKIVAFRRNLPAFMWLPMPGRDATHGMDARPALAAPA
jgi:hypothetical protein